MDSNQQELRRVAEQAFLEAIDQLSDSLQPIERPTNSSASNATCATGESASPAFCNITLEAWEEAAADIEEFMKAREQE